MLQNKLGSYILYMKFTTTISIGYYTQVEQIILYSITTQVDIYPQVEQIILYSLGFHLWTIISTDSLKITGYPVICGNRKLYNIVYNVSDIL